MMVGCAPSQDADDSVPSADDPAAQVIVSQGGRTVSGGPSVGTVSRGGAPIPSTPPSSIPSTPPSNAPSTPPSNAPSASASKASLGRQLFFDVNLSEPAGLACGTCHQERFTFIDPRGGPTSRGAVRDRLGARNTPSILYASLIPPLIENGNNFEGGLFLDGRARSLEDQAAAPFTNPLEMANPSVFTLMAKVRRASYAQAFTQVFGAGVLADDNAGFAAVTEAIAAFEREGTLARFSSRYDQHLAGRIRLTDAELRGLELFEGKAGCAGCHPTAVDPEAPTPGPMFTRFRYFNLGVPRNPDNPFYAISPRFNPDGQGFIDHGLAEVVGNAQHDGKFRTPTLRNVALTAPYGHNGFFPTLHSIVGFYNSRDVADWPPPEVPETIARGFGDLGLTSQEIDDIVVFLNALTDQ